MCETIAHHHAFHSCVVVVVLGLGVPAVVVVVVAAGLVSFIDHQYHCIICPGSARPPVPPPPWCVQSSKPKNLALLASGGFCRCGSRPRLLPECVVRCRFRHTHKISFRHYWVLLWFGRDTSLLLQGTMWACNNHGFGKESRRGGVPQRGAQENANRANA